ncbi:MAG: hypothetical protein EOP82_00840 [Variovorax sp.]|nr:MAG: hypothetical protein EOP82_00840 [Variovorax sp.]
MQINKRDSDASSVQSGAQTTTGPDSHSAPPSPGPGDDAPSGTPGTGESICPICGGNGRDGAGNPCAECKGTGRVNAGIGGG